MNPTTNLPQVEAYTDGSSLGNPGPGGWGVILRYKERTRELAGGFARTTNNRMELLAAIKALEALTQKARVNLYTDSKYLCDAVNKHWIRGWLANGWKTSAKKPVKNQDLWNRLILLLTKHEVRFLWVKGHSGHPDNERCDALAREAASGKDLAVDRGYMQE
ncbi:MAG: ribonuclease HI [Deltaproteobacteria bacterium]|nr:MAG: ribonuclease HI [Deltaproteobacteria bacterium]